MTTSVQDWRYLGITCNHHAKIGQFGICDKCLSDFEQEPLQWLDYGPHPKGDERFLELCRSEPEQHTEQEQQQEQPIGYSLTSDDDDTLTLRPHYRMGHDAGIPF